MKKNMLLAVLLTTVCAFAQDTQEVKKKNFYFEPSGRIKAIYPMQFGDHSLAEAHESSIGFGWNLSFFNYKNLRFSPGVDRAEYRVTDHVLVGNFAKSIYTSIYGSVSYEIPMGKFFSVLPDFGAGYARVAQKNSRKSYGVQEGNEVRVGLNADYKMDKLLSVFISARYIHTYLRMKTDPAYIDFYGKADQVQLAVGLKIN